jgi:hypothetical protein
VSAALVPINLELHVTSICNVQATLVFVHPTCIVRASTALSGLLLLSMLALYVTRSHKRHTIIVILLLPLIQARMQLLVACGFIMLKRLRLRSRRRSCPDLTKAWSVQPQASGGLFPAMLQMRPCCSCRSREMGLPVDDVLLTLLKFVSRLAVCTSPGSCAHALRLCIVAGFQLIVFCRTWLSCRPGCSVSSNVHRADQDITRCIPSKIPPEGRVNYP